jgi:hypothetical protein
MSISDFPGFAHLFVLCRNMASRSFTADIDLTPEDQGSVVRGATYVRQVRAHWAMGSRTPSPIIWTRLVAPILIRARSQTHSDFWASLGGRRTLLTLEGNLARCSTGIQDSLSRAVAGQCKKSAACEQCDNIRQAQRRFCAGYTSKRVRGTVRIFSCHQMASQRGSS